MYYLYILKSQIKDWKYIGITDNPALRLKQHNAGITKSTKGFRPFKLVYTEEYQTKIEARKREIHLKKTFKAREEVFAKIMALSSNG